MIDLLSKSMTKAFFNNCLFFFLGIAILSGQSCGTYYYAANKQNVLKFKEKGDVSASVGVASEGGSGVQNFSLGYAFTSTGPSLVPIVIFHI